MIADAEGKLRDPVMSPRICNAFAPHRRLAASAICHEEPTTGILVSADVLDGPTVPNIFSAAAPLCRRLILPRGADLDEEAELAGCGYQASRPLYDARQDLGVTSGDWKRASRASLLQLVLVTARGPIPTAVPSMPYQAEKRDEMLMCSDKSA
ncbi:hypothetical protein [Bradyrhizobium macuxiense]|uniref:hypothetical protein n=1 Tax=Bradyrhizobium macuxiense TaxID=1755647 RepID=UPI0010A95826|nr:hypothetical protein [Bradyrhizobium macuxiense]